MRKLTSAQVGLGRLLATAGTVLGAFVGFDRYLNGGNPALEVAGLILLFGSSFTWMTYRGGVVYALRQSLKVVIGVIVWLEIDRFLHDLRGRR